MDHHQRLSLSEAHALLYDALYANGVAKNVANSVADALVCAQAEGQVGHGFSRLEDYIKQYNVGKINNNASVKLHNTSATSALIDADNGFAYPAMETAISWGIKTAQELGTAQISVMNSHHCGSLAGHVAKIAQAGFIGIMVANTPAAIAPWGAKTPFFGTNPIAFATPRAKKDPLIIDLALSKVARGKIMNKSKSGEVIPEGWALDQEGNPTTDPQSALSGSMIPIGEAKGAALALIVEILASTLTAACPSFKMSSFLTPDGEAPNAGQFLLVLKVNDPEGFGARLENMLTLIEEMDGARLPGDRRSASIQKAKSQGLNIPTHYINIARTLAHNHE